MSKHDYYLCKSKGKRKTSQRDRNDRQQKRHGLKRQEVKARKK